jgi:hypothetical protein
MQRHCAALDTKHAAAQHDLQTQIGELQVLVREMADGLREQRGGVSDARARQELSDLSGAFAEAQADAHKRADHLGERVAGLVTRILVAERVAQRVDSLEDRVTSVERGIGARLREAEKCDEIEDVAPRDVVAPCQHTDADFRGTYRHAESPNSRHNASLAADLLRLWTAG